MCPCDPDVTGKVYANGWWENGLVKPFVTGAQGMPRSLPHCDKGRVQLYKRLRTKLHSKDFSVWLLEEIKNKAWCVYLLWPSTN